MTQDAGATLTGGPAPRPEAVDLGSALNNMGHLLRALGEIPLTPLARIIVVGCAVAAAGVFLAATAIGQGSTDT